MELFYNTFFLNLAKEFQGRSYDSMAVYTTYEDLSLPY